MQPYDDTEDPLDPKRKIYEGLAGPNAAPAGGTAVEPIKTELPPVSAPSPVAAPSYSKGANAGKNSGMILGFDTDKLGDPNSGSAAGSKYTKDAKVFSEGLKQDVGVSRGGLGNMANFYHDNGFPDATVVGDDKIDPDGPGPMAPIDVIRGDGQIVYQNTVGNPQWEGQGYKPDVGGGGPVGGGGGGVGATAGIPLDALLGGDPMAKIQEALKGLSGPRGNAEELLRQLMGGQGV